MATTVITKRVRVQGANVAVFGGYGADAWHNAWGGSWAHCWFGTNIGQEATVEQPTVSVTPRVTGHASRTNVTVRVTANGLLAMEGDLEGYNLELEGDVVSDDEVATQALKLEGDVQTIAGTITKRISTRPEPAELAA